MIAIFLSSFSFRLRWKKSEREKKSLSWAFIFMVFIKEFITTIICERLCASAITYSNTHKIYNFFHKHFSRPSTFRRWFFHHQFLFSFSPITVHMTLYTNICTYSTYLWKTQRIVTACRSIKLSVFCCCCCYCQMNVVWLFNSFWWRRIACFQFLKCGVWRVFFSCGFDVFVEKCSDAYHTLPKTWSGNFHWTPHSQRQTLPDIYKKWIRKKRAQFKMNFCFQLKSCLRHRHNKSSNSSSSLRWDAYHNGKYSTIDHCAY